VVKEREKVAKEPLYSHPVVGPFPRPDGPKGVGSPAPLFIGEIGVEILEQVLATFSRGNNAVGQLSL
jgi:hypothetical protein